MAALMVIALAVALLPGAPPLSAAEGDTPSVTAVEDILQAPQPQPFAQFGASVAGVGGNVLVGAPGHAVDELSGAGQVYLFGPDGALLDTLGAPDPAAGARFGSSVVGVGDNVLVGAPGHAVDGLSGAGQAYLFGPDGGLIDTLQAPHPQAGAQFGASAAEATGNLLIGAPNHPTSGLFAAGQAYLFGPDGALVETFQAPDPQTSAQFGFSVAGVGDDVLVGARGQDVGGEGLAGEAYLFDQSGGVLQTLQAPAPQAGAQFGFSVAGVGERLLVAAPTENVGDQSNAGQAHLFAPDGALIDTFQAPDPMAGAQFGFSVAGVGDDVLVGAPTHFVDEEGPVGQAYLFDQDGTWRHTLQATDAQARAGFGSAVAGAGESLLLGAPQHQVDNDLELRQAGQAYLFAGDVIDEPDIQAGWLPPVTNGEFALKDGTTLPLKFHLEDPDGGLLTERQAVSLVVGGPCLGGDEVPWDLGDGRDSLRFDENEATYTANFHTRDHALEDGEECTATVLDGDATPLADSMSFSVSTERGTGRGNKP